MQHLRTVAVASLLVLATSPARADVSYYLSPANPAIPSLASVTFVSPPASGGIL